MGSPVSPIVANLFMEWFEEVALQSFPYDITVWKRYVDDTFVCCLVPFLDRETHTTHQLHRQFYQVHQGGRGRPIPPYARYVNTQRQRRASLLLSIQETHTYRPIPAVWLKPTTPAQTRCSQNSHTQMPHDLLYGDQRAGASAEGPRCLGLPQVSVEDSHSCQPSPTSTQTPYCR